MNSNQSIQLNAFQAFAMEYNRIQDKKACALFHIGKLIKALWKGFRGQYTVSIAEARVFINDDRHNNTWTERFLKRELRERKISLPPPSKNYLPQFISKSSENNRHDKRSTGLHFTIHNARTNSGKPFSAQMLNAVPGYVLRDLGFSEQDLSELKVIKRSRPFSYEAARQLTYITREEYDRHDNSQGYILGESMSKVKFAMVQLAEKTEPILCAAKKAAPGLAFADKAAVINEVELQSRSGCSPEVFGYSSTEKKDGKKQFIIFMDIARGTGADRKKEKADQEEKLLLMKEVLIALCKMHSNGVFPCDIKPRNIIFTQAGKAQFIDFGMATSESRRHPVQYNDRYFLANIAPESITTQNLWGTQRDLVDSKSADIFALGVFLTSYFGRRQLFANKYWVPLPPDSPPDRLTKAEAAIKKSVGQEYGAAPIRNCADLQRLIDEDLDKIDLPPTIKSLAAKMLRADPRQRIQPINALLELKQLVQKNNLAEAAA